MQQPSSQPNYSHIYLASKSPRRRELLRQIGVHHEILTADVDESPLPGESPSEYVVRLAIEKAQAGYESLAHQPRMPVLAADTTVSVNDEIMGKPATRDEFLAMMRLLSGRSHKVLTGVALVADGTESRLSISSVDFCPVSSGQARAYWASGEPTDKAGGYAIQGLGAMFVSRLDGSYSGVMGLPLFETAELLRTVGIRLWPTATESELNQDPG